MFKSFNYVLTIIKLKENNPVDYRKQASCEAVALNKSACFHCNVTAICL